MRLPKNEMERSRLTYGVVYPLGDTLSREEQKGFELPSLGLYVGAFASREFRPIRPGEWYLSGAEITAYKAENGTSDAYHVAHLVSYRHAPSIEVIK